MRALDLFCGAGGASMGLSRAGFDVTGIDIAPQKRYPYPCTFHQGDAMAHGFDLSSFDLIWASPPCQRYSTMTKKWGRSEDHPDLIAPVREMLIDSGVPYIIENVPGAPLIDPIMLCGSMFNLTANGGQVRRHRMFELSFPIDCLIPPCAHKGRAIAVYGHAGGSSKRDGLVFGGTDEWREAMGIPWMIGRELAESIPPAYAQFIGEVVMRHITR